MDFGTLLHAAQKNERSSKKEPIRCYSTKFEPPKKEQRSKQLSANIKKFLAKKEAEEKRKQLEATKKKEDLLALRAQDKKATRRVNVMLKRTKSANQSVIEDAVDKNHTSVTLVGSAQPDEDDYGYVSKEAEAFYNKMMEKYSQMPDEPKFNFDKKKKISNNLNSTKDRVKAALEQEKEEANMPHRRARKRKAEALEEEEPPRAEPPRSEAPRSEAPRPKHRPAAPPPMNFSDLLKIAEKKQFEPVVIEQKPKEEERPLTKKQRKEMEREKEWRDRREGKLPPLDRPPANKIPKLSNGAKANGDLGGKIPKLSANGASRPAEAPKRPQPADRKPNVPNANRVDAVRESNPGSNKVPSRNSVPSKTSSTKVAPISSNLKSLAPKPKSQTDLKPRDVQGASGRPREIPPRDLQARKPPVGDVRPKQLPPKDLKPKQFPPPDVRRKEFPPRDVKRKPLVNKRRILDDDEEYDSEMDDFIDDGPGEEEDYSKYISEIFGYDKSKYRNMDEDVDNMESTFAQQMKEEVISTRIGIMEDLEDIKKEEEEKRRKALMKKKRKL